MRATFDWCWSCLLINKDGTTVWQTSFWWSHGEETFGYKINTSSQICDYGHLVQDTATPSVKMPSPLSNVEGTKCALWSQRPGKQNTFVFDPRAFIPLALPPWEETTQRQWYSLAQKLPTQLLLTHITVGWTILILFELEMWMFVNGGDGQGFVLKWMSLPFGTHVQKKYPRSIGSSTPNASSSQLR